MALGEITMAPRHRGTTRHNRSEEHTNRWLEIRTTASPTTSSFTVLCRVTGFRMALGEITMAPRHRGTTRHNLPLTLTNSTWEVRGSDLALGLSAVRTRATPT